MSDDETIDEARDELNYQIAEKHGLETVWSIDGADFDSVPFPDAKRLRYWCYSFFIDGKPSEERREFAVDLQPRSTYLDLWKATDSLAKQSGDKHHRYIEDFTDEGDGTLTVFLGS